MATIRELLIKINGDNSGLGNALRGAGEDLKALQEHAKKTGEVFSNLGKKLSTYITLPILAVGVAAVKSSADMEMLQASFTTMLGDATKAQKFLDEIKKMAAATPFDTTQLATAAKTLKQFGLDTESIIPTLKQIGDISGGNAEKMSALSLAFGQMSSAGRLMGQDLLQMINAGFNPLNEIAKRTGESMSELKDRMAKGGVSAREVARAFEDVTSAGGMFFGGMERGSQTLSGLTSTLRDDVMEMARSFGDILLPKIKEIVRGLSEWAKKLQQMTPEQKEMVLKIAMIAAAIGPVLLGLGAAAKAVTTFSVAIKFLNTSALGGPLGLIALLAGSIIALVSFAQNAKKAQDRLKDLYENPQNYGTEELDKQLVGMNKTLAQINKQRSEQEASMRRQGATQKEIKDSLESIFGAEERIVTANRDRVQVEVNKRRAIEAAQKAQEAADAAELEAIRKSLYLMDDQARMAGKKTEAYNAAYTAIGELNAKTEAFEGNAEKAAKALDDEKKKIDAAAAAQKKFKDSIVSTLAGVNGIIGALTNLATTLGVDSDAMETFGGIAQDAIAGVTAALTGNWLGIATAALGVIDKIVKWFKKGDEAAREARRTTESYMETIKTGEGKLLNFIKIMEKMRSTTGILRATVEIDFSKLTLFKELAASYGDSIGQTLGDAIVNGMSKVDFMAKIGEILINAMIAAALATGPIASAMAAIGEKIAYMVVNGFTDEGMAEVEAMASNLYDLFSGNILPIVQKIRDMFGTSGGSEETGSFASGVTDWKGGIARVGEQGPETVRLPRGASVEPAGITRGNVSMTFNSPRALSPMEMKMQMMAASRQLAFETGGNL